MSEPLRSIWIDNRMEQYENYLPDDWAGKLYDASNASAGLYQMVVDLVLAWRTTAYTAMMPATAIKAMQAATLGYATYNTSDAGVVYYSEAILAKVSRKVPELVEDRNLRARLISELAIVADEFRTAGEKVKPEMPIEPLWREFLEQDAFRLSVWSSQRVAYVAFYNAYEAFLVDNVKRALGVASLRATSDEFKEGLRIGFAKDISTPCWTHHEINNARLVRHALSHAGGRETADLNKQRHGVKIVDGVLQIVPADIHGMLRRLRPGVDAVVAAAVTDPKFA
jgi:hypothetical protein